MMKNIGIALLIALLAVPALFAARSGSMPSGSKMNPRDQAIEDYNSGERRLEKLTKLHDEMKAATNPKETEKLRGKLKKGLENAVGDFERAVRNDPNMYQAHSELGFAPRKLGKYDESLAAYDKALELRGDFSPAIEYRAEAYLGLNRIEDAKQAYAILFAGDRPRADILMGAMKSYVAARQADAAGLDAAQLDAFANWVVQREAIHTQTTSLSAEASTFRSW
ncbi:MAG: hypothetical protein JJE51_02665 [Thermoanaerobaculia bacterium]|nr:hypothetical protein [Thermoanaerobaculia bacterium]